MSDPDRPTDRPRPANYSRKLEERPKWAASPEQRERAEAHRRQERAYHQHDALNAAMDRLTEAARGMGVISVDAEDVRLIVDELRRQKD